MKENNQVIFRTNLVTRGQSVPDLIVSIVKYILERPLWIYGESTAQIQRCYAALMCVRSRNILPENSPAHTNHGYFIASVIVHHTLMNQPNFELTLRNYQGHIQIQSGWAPDAVYHLPSIPNDHTQYTRGKSIIDLVTVFDAILTSRQTREKLQLVFV